MVYRTKRKLRGIHFIKCLTLKYLNFEMEIDEITELFSCHLCIIYKLRSDRFYKIKFNYVFLFFLNVPKA